MAQQPFNALADELQDFTTAVVTKAHLNAPDLRRVLSFIAKVSHVAEQAFQDVVAVLIEIKYLTPADLDAQKNRDLQKQLELLTVRSRYRDVEEICSRLHHLSDQYHEQIAPLVSGVGDAHSWGGIFGLINEHEGRLISLVYQSTGELRQRLEALDSASLGGLTRFAAEQLTAVRNVLDQLRELSNKILGVSGTAGLLELTAESGNTGPLTSLFVSRGDFFMSRDQYEIGQAGAVGPGAHAENMTFNQIWNKSGSAIDVQQLGRELTALRTALNKEASEPEQFVALGEVAAAEKAAKEGDGPTALRHLKTAGAWVWDVATRVGIGVATAAAKTAIGI
jgi:hypothetical protein